MASPEPNPSAEPAPRVHLLVTQPLHPQVLARLTAVATVDMNPGPHPWSDADIQQRLARAHGWIAFMTDRLDRETLRHAPHLRHVACALKGSDNFDAQACAAAGVGLSVVPDLLTEPTAELAIGLAIAAGRHLVPGDRLVREGRFAGWRPQLYGTGLHGCTAAIVGMGAVGRAIARRLSGFDCGSVLGVDPLGTPNGIANTPLDEALARADVVFLAAPLTAATRHLINRRRLDLMRPGALLVNVGRGSVVNERDVAEALHRGHLGAYAADVFEMEDWLLPDRPDVIHPDLRASPRTVFSPHLGSAVASVRLAIEHAAATQLLEALHLDRQASRAA